MATTKVARATKRGRKPDESTGNGKLKAKAYERELAKLHGELVKLQLWVVQ